MSSFVIELTAYHDGPPCQCSEDPSRVYYRAHKITVTDALLVNIHVSHTHTPSRAMRWTTAADAQAFLFQQEVFPTLKAFIRPLIHYETRIIEFEFGSHEIAKGVLSHENS